MIKQTQSKGAMPTPDDHGRTLDSWQFPEFIKYKRSRAWYITAVIVSLGLIIYAVLTGNFLFAFIIILIAFIILIYETKEPILMKFNITEDGLELGSHFYSYKDINIFWIIYEPPEVKRLYFDFKSGLRQKLSIPFLDQNPLEIRKILLEYLGEDLEKEDESLTDFLERQFKL